MWITLTENDLNEYLAATQLKALQTKALAAGQSDPLPNYISEVVASVRAVIAGAGLPLETQPGTFPEVLKPSVAALVIELAQTRLPGLSLTIEQKAQASNARAVLGNIAARKLAIETPANPDYSLSAQIAQARMRVISKGEVTKGKELKKLG